MSERLILGIDGGGTGTTAALARFDDPNVTIGMAEAGPSNIRSVGTRIGLDNLDLAIQRVFANAGISRTSVAAAVLGLAGTDRNDDRKIVEDWATSVRLAEKVKVVNDALPILYYADASGCGIALIAGTGSFAFGRTSEGRTVRCGGWGHLLGDEGSGYHIALAGMHAAVRSADGRDEKTDLLPRFLKWLGQTETQGFVRTVYQPGMDRAKIAALAGVVFESAQFGDPTARRIIMESAFQLGEMVKSVAGQLFAEDDPFPLAFAGGIILNQSMLRDQLTDRLQKIGLRFGSICAVPTPVMGALRLAVRLQ